MLISYSRINLMLPPNCCNAALKGFLPFCGPWLQSPYFYVKKSGIK